MTAHLPKSETLRVCELFASVQGEGPSLGTPATFLRLAGCNLACRWCDTEYSWNFKRYDARECVTTRPVADVTQELLAVERPLLVLTGGEPLLQQSAVASLLLGLPTSLSVEVETNGTLLPNASLFERVDQFNVSPKLANSGEPVERRLNLPTLRALRDHRSAWLKLVVVSPSDLAEADALVERVGWPRSRVILMPEGRDAVTLNARSTWLVPACLERGYRFSPRLHVLLWGDRRGV